MMTLEIAMDEMAEKLGMDPVRFRTLNDTQVDPEKPERPFSTRQLVECLRTGAERFGWNRRQAQPGFASPNRLARAHRRVRRPRLQASMPLA
jgi:xanthine dehydrogenase YagR molybdenum-binding subunit